MVKVPCFLECLSEDGIVATKVWNIRLRDNVYVEGPVIFHKVTSDYIPITITVETTRGPVEIPWNAVQTIQYLGEN